MQQRQKAQEAKDAKKAREAMRTVRSNAPSPTTSHSYAPLPQASRTAASHNTTTPYGTQHTYGTLTSQALATVPEGGWAVGQHPRPPNKLAEFRHLQPPVPGNGFSLPSISKSMGRHGSGRPAPQPAPQQNTGGQQQPQRHLPAPQRSPQNQPSPSRPQRNEDRYSFAYFNPSGDPFRKTYGDQKKYQRK